MINDANYTRNLKPFILIDEIGTFAAEIFVALSVDFQVAPSLRFEEITDHFAISKLFHPG